jgi:hypothetical protein
MSSLRDPEFGWTRADRKRRRLIRRRTGRGPAGPSEKALKRAERRKGGP